MIKPSQIPSTGRKPLFLVKQLGFNSVARFAESLPEGALVADIGAGLSTFGQEVASMRADIHWINVDPCYLDKKIARWLPENLPPNLELLTDNITLESDTLSGLNAKMDFVFSYWLIPHLSLEDDTAARTAIKNMTTLLKREGKMAVGPIRKHGILSSFRYRGTIIYDKQNIDADEIIRKTKLWWLPRTIQRFSNQHNIHIGLRFVGGH